MSGADKTEEQTVIAEEMVLSSRARGKAFVESHPDIDPQQPVIIDCSKAKQRPYAQLPESLKQRLSYYAISMPEEGVQLLTPSFADEVLAHWPHASLFGAGEEVQITWDVAAERRKDG